MTTTQKINELKGLYQFESPYHEDKRLLHFEVIGNSYNKEYPLKVQTVDYRGRNGKGIVSNYSFKAVEELIKNGTLKKVKAPNLNPLFIDQIPNFAHLVTVEPKTKTAFLNDLKTAYDTNNPKTELFYLATEKSCFDTIRLSDTRSQILFNH